MKKKAKPKTYGVKPAKPNAKLKRLIVEKGGLNKEWAKKHLIVLS